MLGCPERGCLAVPLSAVQAEDQRVLRWCLLGEELPRHSLGAGVSSGLPSIPRAHLGRSSLPGGVRLAREAVTCALLGLGWLGGLQAGVGDVVLQPADLPIVPHWGWGRHTPGWG